ncbi:MAG: ATP-binding protein [Candidatus Pacebacteria bacterium]|nr:ATP-binding protein [Candidatus Paceibacterota bacterium]
MLDYLPVGIMLLNSEKKIKLVNKDMRSLVTTCLTPASGHSGPRTELSTDAMPLLSLECIKDRNDANLSLRRVVESGDGRADADGRERMMICEETQRLFEVRTRTLPKIWPDGYSLVVVKDQTVYEQLVKETLMEKYQRMLISSISHEIRNPLNAIQGYTSMILESQSKQDIAVLCSKMEREIRGMDFTLAGACDLMINVSGGDGGQPIQVQSFNLRSAIREVEEMVQPGMEQKSIELLHSIDSNVPDEVCSDPKKYKLILFHLLSNSTKYTDAGSITVSLRYECDTRTLTTQVVDTGIGIAADRIEKLFELYANMEHVNPYNPQGMGLGLTLCKKLSRSLGGDISASSEPGKGSIFGFHIRTSDCGDCSHKDAELLVPSERSDNGPRSMRGCKCSPVLVVDDEATNRLVLKSYLRSLGIVPDEAENGRQALKCMQSRSMGQCCQRYRLVLMDINMPDMDGTTATTEMVRMFGCGSWGRCPIVAVTAANLQTRIDIQNLLSVGFNEIGTDRSLFVVQKPVTKAAFLKIVKPYLK